MKKPTTNIPKFNDDCALLLTHIPKCAGTSFRNALVVPNIPSSMIFSPESGLSRIMRHKQDFQYLVGHFPVGVEQFYSLRSPARKRHKILVTFLRDPLDQMISYYWFQIQLENCRPNKFANDHNAIVEYYKNTPRARNLQTQLCSGIIIERILPRIGIMGGCAFQLKRAKRNLINRFHFVGQFENADGDMKLLAEYLGIKYVPTHSEITRTKRRPSVSEIDPEIAKALLEINYLDRELYTYAQSKIWDSRGKEQPV